MDQAIRNVLAEYEARADKESEIMASVPLAELTHRIDDFLICIGPDTGQLLHMLARSMQAKTLVEVGASYGYSTIWLADAARETGGKVHSFELSQKKVDFATDKLRGLGLAEYVQFHVGDALSNLPKLDQPLDLVLIDCWKSLYIPAFKLVAPKLADGGFIVADNMLHPPETRKDAQKYQAYIRDAHDLESLLLPVGSGLELTRKKN
jgi:predicted O-methyltransferase YrrM